MPPFSWRSALALTVPQGVAQREAGDGDRLGTGTKLAAERQGRRPRCWKWPPPEMSRQLIVHRPRKLTPARRVVSMSLGNRRHDPGRGLKADGTVPRTGLQRLANLGFDTGDQRWRFP